MKRNVLLACGLVAPLLYTAVVIFGGAIRPGLTTSGMHQRVGRRGAPIKSLSDTLFSVYNCWSCFALACSACSLPPRNLRSVDRQWGRRARRFGRLERVRHVLLPSGPTGAP